MLMLVSGLVTQQVIEQSKDIKGSQNCTNEVAVNGASYLGGNVTSTSNIARLNHNLITREDRHYVREENDGAHLRD